MVGYKPHELNVLIDTDGGSDDVVAIAMALLDNVVSANTITCVAGNVNLQQCRNNVWTLLDKMNLKYNTNTYDTSDNDTVHVFTGMTSPLLRPLVTADETHGEDGLSGLSEYSSADTNNPVAHMNASTISIIVQASLRRDRIVCIGPLTNIALACTLVPQAMQNADLWIMGSAGLGEGNVDPITEYNFYVDSDAAKIVFDTCNNIHVIGWDVCMHPNTVKFDEKDIRKLSKSELGRWLIDTNKQLIDLNMSRFGYTCIDFADPVAMACALRSEICKFKTFPVTVTNTGSMLVDRYNLFNYAKRVQICTEVAASKWKELLFENILNI